MTYLHPWYVRSHPLQHRTGSDIFARLFGHRTTIATLLESPYPPPPEPAQAQLGQYSICAGPPRTIAGQPRLWAPQQGRILSTLAELQRWARRAAPSPLIDADRGQPVTLPCFSGGWLGWLGYDLAWEIERLPRQRPDPLSFPVAFWYEPDCFAVLDHRHQQLWLAASCPAQLMTLEQSLHRAEPFPSLHHSLAADPLVDQLSFGSTQAEYEQAVRRAKGHIQAGDIFQANLSLRFETRTAADSWAIYRALQRINPSPFSSYWRSPWGALISCSPERLVQVKGRKAQTRPIAGTRPRGQTGRQDQVYGDELRSHPKEIAEHIMLVDLVRNDLGRVCQWGTVQVSELLTIERYSHVMHLVSNVVGQLQPQATVVDVIRAIFPGGTITGCPKVRCMEIINELEPVRRSLFYGSCGYLDWRGQLDLNILIRTLLWAPQPGATSHRVWGQVGAGIVADSQPHREWQESLQKAKAQLQALGIELERLA
ncbi:Anthranilate synthase component I-like protein [Halomicronema hongdechloris C2206]|uniref:Anthranilate synthase component 1 n=1 Tax=Halomicronema hongdechloris C2206 TaxID=1641165 RepID=A0A1Z3HUD4_9CYAN|nr:anthranilate synthase component I [Halomicronema hongdechloris]ASC73928.1 Anthranilate synthase component I-like protein [Halomicronema hongdechloris C2206]